MAARRSPPEAAEQEVPATATALADIPTLQGMTPRKSAAVSMQAGWRKTRASLRATRASRAAMRLHGPHLGLMFGEPVTPLRILWPSVPVKPSSIS